MTDFGPSFNLVLGNSLGPMAQGGFLGANVLPPTGMNVTTVVSVPQVTFVLRGFFLGTGQYEIWSGTSRNTPPPSGHSLNDITVIAEMVGTGAF